MEGTELLQRQKTTLRSLVIIALFLLCPIGKASWNFLGLGAPLLL